MKHITITVPDNCELKQDGNTYIIVEKEKKLTYEDVIKNLFSVGRNVYYIEEDGSISSCINDGLIDNAVLAPNNCISLKQAEKLLAINKLMNVAKYLNGDWQPDWNNCIELKYYIRIYEDKIEIDSTVSTKSADVYFKSNKLAKQAIEILGRDTIRLALCSDY